MALYVKDPEVGALANRLAEIKKLNKTEAVRLALRNEIERLGCKAPPSPRVQEVLRIVRELREQANPGGKPADKAWIDSLYEED